MKSTETQIMNEVRKGTPQPVYLLSGEEPYFTDVLADFFEHHVVPEENRDFDQQILYGRDTDMTTVVSLARELPLMSERRLLLIKEAQDIGKGSNRQPKNEWDHLLPYLQKPNPTTVLVFCYRNKAFDKRSKVYKAIDGIGVCCEHKKVYDNEVPSHILQMVSSHGYQITESAARLLAAHIGTNLSKIANELTKLYISLPAGSTITESAIEKNIGISKDYNIFELQAAIGRKDAALCTRITNHFAANPKDNPMPLTISTLYNYFTKLMIYIQEPDKSQKHIAEVLGISPFFVKDYESAARHYSLSKLASCIDYLYDADLRSKGIRNTGTITEGELLKEIVFKFIH